MFTFDEELFRSSCGKIGESITEVSNTGNLVNEAISLSAGLEVDISSVQSDLNDVEAKLNELNGYIANTTRVLDEIAQSGTTIGGSHGSEGVEQLVELLIPTSPFESTYDGEYGAAQASPYELFRQYMESKGCIDDEENYYDLDDFDEDFDDEELLEHPSAPEYGVSMMGEGGADEDEEDDGEFSSPGFIPPNFGAPSLTEEEQKQVNDIIKLFNEKGITDEAVMLEVLEWTKRQACGHTAITNWVAEMYSDKPEEFEKKFGYPLFVEKNGMIKYNYETLLTDIYLDANDKFLSDNVTAEGFEAVNEDSSIHPDEMADKMSHFLGEEYEAVVVQHDVSAETYQKYKEEGYDYAVVAAYRYDMNAYGENMYGDYIGDKETEDGHWMTITGVTDNDKLLLSSWGSAYELEQSALYAKFPVDGVQETDRDDTCMVFLRKK